MIDHLQKEPAAMSQAASELPVLDFQTVEFYVSNAKQAAFFYNKMLGFDIVAYRGPETGQRETCSYVMQQNNIQLVLTAALFPDHPVSRHVALHGDGVKDIGFAVSDVTMAYETALQRGATSVMPPSVLKDEFGTVEKATISTYGDTTHTFINRSGYTGLFEPGYIEKRLPAESTGLQRIDHVVGNVETGRMDYWVRFYEEVFGFYLLRHYDEKDISTQYSALVSKVMANKSGTVKMPINEPAKGLKKSQIEEYLDYYKSAGAQHLALSTEDIVFTVRSLRERGLELMTVPQSYYNNISERVGQIHESIEELAQLGILIDRDEKGYLLQIFTHPVQDRPTFFFEIIQRVEGAEGFGKGNFKALFEAIERDQARRGNL